MENITTEQNSENVPEWKKGIRGFFEGQNNSDKIANMETFNKSLIDNAIRNSQQFFYIADELKKLGYSVMRAYKNE